MFELRLKELREEKGYSQEQLARKLGVRQSTVGMWENGRNKPKNEKLERLANIFDVSTDYLLGRNDQREMRITQNKGVKIPVIGEIRAGIPLSAIQEVEDYEEISESLARTGQYVGLRVKGDSMLPDIKDGDIAIIRVQGDIETGQIAAVLVNGEDATIKKIKRTDYGIVLIGLNPSVYEPHPYTFQEMKDLPIKIFGKLVEVRRKY